MEERLHRAARDDDDRLARTMIERGVDIEARDREGFTPLYRAIKSRSHKVAKVLLEDGKFVQMERTVKKEINNKETFSGADPNAKNGNPYGWTPLHRAAENDDLEGAKILIQYGANINQRDYEGNLLKIEN